MSLTTQHYVPESALAALRNNATEDQINLEQNVQVTKSNTKKSAVTDLKNTYLAVVHGATEKYVAGIRSADNKFADLMQNADFELKSSLSHSSTKSWAKRSNIIDSYVTEMLKNIDNNVPSATIANQVNNEFEQNADGNHLNIKTAQNQSAIQDGGSSSYTTYRNSIIAAKKVLGAAVEKYKQQLYNSIATAHSKLCTTIQAHNMANIATHSLQNIYDDVQTVETEFKMALKSAEANFEATAHLT